ncbi:APC family permease [Mycoplasmopsis cynos]|uniref:APC family permease n=1 Tax=Mycoplasmopsis cynos TaxID=171284 RepID=UPI0024C83C22|nr:APC family permease [Mycoplasmopsis cynos]WAM09157.1 APC family permease [Mycoplasmopsis cynos]
MSNSWYSLPLAIVTWILSSFAVVCMALSLVEVAKKNTGNLSMIGWVKDLSSRFMYKTCKNFMFYIYIPLAFFFMPIYALQTIQDALASFGFANNFNTSVDWLIWGIIGLAISLWFIFVSGISVKAGNIQNWIITVVKFLPLLIITILGFYVAKVTQPEVLISPDQTKYSYTSFTSLSPGIGFFISFAAIFFSFDGFYYSLGIRTEMKQPKRSPFALVLGLSIVTIIYLIIAISMTVAYPKSGQFSAFITFLQENKLGWLAGVTNLFIAIGIIGIVNNLAMWSSRLAEELIQNRELPFAHKYIYKLNENKPIIGTIYTAIITIFLCVIFTLIGGLTYLPNSYLDESGKSLYDGIGYFGMARLLGFADLMGNWTSIFAFSYIIVAIIGRLIKRKNDINNSEKFKYFVPCAIISIFLVSSSLILQTIAPFVDLFLLVLKENQQYDIIVSRVMIIVVFVIFLIFMIVPTIFDYDSKYAKKIYKNIAIK